MGVNLKELFESKEIKVDDLRSKTLVVDGFNMLYQFLTTIRQPDGAAFTDSHGNVTSHLIGLHSRCANFMCKGIKLAFVFDGKPPKIKEAERARRRGLKDEALVKYEEAIKEKDVASMKKYGSRIVSLTPEIIKESQELLDALGLPWVQAPSEGEAQAAYMVKKGHAWASVSQDYDSLLYGCPKLIQNLSAAGRRKKTAKLGTVIVQPTLIELASNLKRLGLSNDQLIALAILVGTDYNYGGVHGIGPKKAYRLVKLNGEHYPELFKDVDFQKHSEHTWKEIFDTFKDMPVTDDYKLKWDMTDGEKIRKLLIDRHDFSADRVEKTISDLNEANESTKQKSLFDY